MFLMASVDGLNNSSLAYQVIKPLLNLLLQMLVKPKTTDHSHAAATILAAFKLMEAHHYTNVSKSSEMSWQRFNLLSLLSAFTISS